jgi:uncharacterized membrane protein
VKEAMYKTILVTTATALLMDAVWLTARADYHKKLFKSVQGSDITVRIIPALLIYILIPVAVVVFAVAPSKTLQAAVLSGLFLGFAMYGVYDLTNLATFKGWTLEMTLIDMAWGTFLCGSAAAVGFYVKNKTKE